MPYHEDDYLQLSGLQHFAFCRRQWALIHVENQWAENFRTTDGKLMHTNAHNKGFHESRGDMLILRGLAIHSAELGISGECDVVEFHRVSNGVPLAGREGLWQPFPVEYKRGRPGAHTHADSLQLCAQALCLEEMLCCPVPQGALYYGETRHREPVELDEPLREEVKAMLTEMHQLYRRGATPKVKPSKSCSACSLQELCLPRLMRVKSASGYLRAHMEEED
ncbi:MAG: CRISPR-associated protein Cas4 [Oscillospiraceae bacterium]|nr:CRISPR-associated protein Cas4 [Oscillospiraceae bacterium]